jgi:hypothetical protein
MGNPVQFILVLAVFFIVGGLVFFDPQEWGIAQEF